jgi:hypothetical protein
MTRPERSPARTARPSRQADVEGEGLAVLPEHRHVIGSDTGPSFEIFDRTGTMAERPPVPARFRVAPAREEIDNTTIEGTAVCRRGGSLRRDGEHARADAPGTWRGWRILVDEHGPHGNG